jgi:hypothetical protein
MARRFAGRESMVIRWRALAVQGALMVLLTLAAPAPMLADHCGADATVTPPSGSAGTTFVFATNLGEPSDVYVYRDGSLVAQAYIPDSGDFTYAIATGSGDDGSWRVHAQLRSSPDCAADAAFIVLGSLDTSTASPRTDRGWPWSLVLLAGTSGFIWAWRRRVSE